MRNRFLILAMAALWALPRPATAQASVPDGKQTFDIVCASCHSLNPPANKAPPMTHVVRHYRQAFASDSAGIEAIVQWVLKPEQARSKMPAQAIERFGLMPAFPLPEAQVREVAAYVWSLGGG